MRTSEPGSRGREWYLFAELRRLVAGGLCAALFFSCGGLIAPHRSWRIHSLFPTGLKGAELSRKPTSWQQYDFWLADWKHQFRCREGLVSVGQREGWPIDKLDRFRAGTADRWAVATRSLAAPALRDADLRETNLHWAFLCGADLRGALFEQSAQLSNVSLEGADLQRVQLAVELGCKAPIGAE